MSIEAVFAVALVGIMAGLAVGAVRRTALWSKHVSVKAVELRDEVWSVGMLQKAYEQRLRPNSKIPPTRDPGDLWGEKAAWREGPFPESLEDIRLDPKKGETLIRCRLKGREPFWVVGGLQGTRRWRPW